MYLVPAIGGEPRLAAAGDVASDQWRPGTGGAELALTHGRAIVTVAPDGSSPRDLVPRSMIAGEPVGSADAGFQSGIVFGSGGPDRDSYRLRSGHTFTVENRSDVPVALFSGLTEKDAYCRLVAGKSDSVRPCTIQPHSTIGIEQRVMADEVLMGWIGPARAGWQGGFPVILDLEAAP